MGQFIPRSLVALLIACFMTPVLAQSPPPAEPAKDKTISGQSDPQLRLRPAPRPASDVVPEGRLRIDVVVNDAAGKPVSGLKPWDFHIVDNDRPLKVLSFRAYDGGNVLPKPPVEVILVIDSVNMPFQQLSAVEQQVKGFFRQNNGELAQPVTLMVLTDRGLRVLPHPTRDGKALADALDRMSGVISFINPAMGSEGLIERFQLSVRQMSAIAENEALKPGRKLLIWVGPGWPMMDRPKLGYSERVRRVNFSTLVELSTRLREARVAAYSVSLIDPTATGRGSTLYQSFLKGVQSPRDVEPGNLALKVLVSQTGGQILGPDNDLVSQINRCISDANHFYRLSFNPPPAEHADEYHDLNVLVDQPGLTVRTNTGYYNQPPGN